jgi:spermidine/putrescine transport system permease protein
MNIKSQPFLNRFNFATLFNPIYVVYAWLALFCLVPLALIFIASFMSKDSTHLVTLPLTIKHYLYLLSPAFLHILIRSVAIALFTTLCCLLLAYPFSYILIKSRYHSVLLILIIIPFWTSSLVRTYSLLSILKLKGLLNAILLKLHLIDAPLNLLYSNIAVVGGLVYTLFPFMVLPLFTQMERFDFRLIEAGKDLGASRLNVFFRIFLPNTRPGIYAGCILVFLPAMTLFYIPNILGGARSMLIGNMIQNQFLVLEDWPQGAASSVMLTLCLLLLLIFYRRSPRELRH